MEMFNEDDEVNYKISPKHGRMLREFDPQRRGGTTLSGVPVGDIVKQLLEGGLLHNIEKIAKQQVALAVGEASNSAPSSSRTSENIVREQGGSGRRLLLLGSEAVDRFNPDDVDIDIEKWLHRIDRLGVIYGWSNEEMSSLALSRLDGPAKSWFRQLDDCNLRWAQWKEKLKAAFARCRDFAVMLEELIERQKLPTESMATYYKAKLALCDRVRFQGVEAVSCIIRGLPKNLRDDAHAANCATPEALYNLFLARLEMRYHGEVPRRATIEPKVPVAPRRDEGLSRKRCFNCQQITNHLSKNCPLPRAERCMGCGAREHKLAECPERQTGGGSAEVPIRRQDGRMLRVKREGEHQYPPRAVRGRYNH